MITTHELSLYSHSCSTALPRFAVVPIPICMRILRFWGGILICFQNSKNARVPRTENAKRRQLSRVALLRRLALCKTLLALQVSWIMAPELSARHPHLKMTLPCSLKWEVCLHNTMDSIHIITLILIWMIHTITLFMLPNTMRAYTVIKWRPCSSRRIWPRSSLNLQENLISSLLLLLVLQTQTSSRVPELDESQTNVHHSQLPPLLQLGLSHPDEQKKAKKYSPWKKTKCISYLPPHSKQATNKMLPLM